MFLFYLGDGLFSGAFQLEFNHVDVVRSFYHEVNPSFGRMIFCLGIETYQFEDDEEHVLVVPFQLACQFVGSIGKESLQTFEKGFRLSGAYLTYKFLYLKRRFYLRETGVERYQELDKPFLYFPVGKSEAV